MSRFDSFFPPYISVAQRRENAEKMLKKLKKTGVNLQPVVVHNSRKITQTFWGTAWCNHLLSYADFETRLPRGRSYLHHGCVIDLKILPSQILAQVLGSSLYHVQIDIKPLRETAWQKVVKRCSGKIDSLVALLQGKFSSAIMKHLIDQKEGILPQPHEIKMRCSCPDHATMCKHIAAVLYGVGVRLDNEQRLLFVLRQVNEEDLFDKQQPLLEMDAGDDNLSLQDADLLDIFGVELVEKFSDAPKVASGAAKRAEKRVSKIKTPRKAITKKTVADVKKKAKKEKSNGKSTKKVVKKSVRKVLKKAPKK